MAFAVRTLTVTAILLSLLAVALSLPQGSWVAGSIREPPVLATPCVPLNRSSVLPLFADIPSPHVGYFIDEIENRDMQLQKFTYMDNHFHGLKLNLVVGDQQCFSNLPNMVSFLTFYFYTPCFNPTVITLNTGEEITTDFFLVPPCRSLCVAALEELARFEMPCESLEEACPSIRNLTHPIDTLLERYSDAFNCSNYPIDGTRYSACVPRRGPCKSCDPIPCNHPVRVIVPDHFQTGYCPEQSNQLTSPTHLRSFNASNREFRDLGLDKMMLDDSCKKKLPSVVSFLAFAYFPVCTAFPDKDVSLAFPCRGYCEKAREELSKYNSREELIRDCPAARHMPALSLETVLGLPIFNCPRYKPDNTLCIPIPNGDSNTREETPTPSTPAPVRCLYNTCPSEYKCRTKIRPGPVKSKTFGVNVSRYDYACVMNYIDSFSGPCVWSLTMRVRHCYFYDSDAIPLPEGYGSNITVVLQKTRLACGPCGDILQAFGAPSLNANRDYLVAGQHIRTYTGDLGWGLDHTRSNSLVTEHNGSNTERKIERSIRRLIGYEYLRWNH